MQSINIPVFSEHFSPKEKITHFRWLNSTIQVNLDMLYLLKEDELQFHSQGPK